MITKKVLDPTRIRHIEGGFSFIPHRFLTDGFIDTLNQKELLLYIFLCIVSDRYGLSFYAYDAICSILQLSLDNYIEARDCLIKKGLIDFDGTIFQVLELPVSPIKITPKESCIETGRTEQRSGISTLIQQSLWENRDG
jgi:hypothetical protein